MGQQVDLAVAAALPNGDGLVDALQVNGKSRVEQRRLPLPKNLGHPLGESDFAHPAEINLARIFSFYRVRWVYEPTTFHLVVDDQGRPLEQVTPDFYLPDHDVYVELTTMRQSLVTRKNRKIRRLKEAFPTLQVRLLYRKDYDRLVGSCLTHAESAAAPGKPVFSELQIQQRIAALAGELAADSGLPVGSSVRWDSSSRSPRAVPQLHHGDTYQNNGNGFVSPVNTSAREHLLVGLGPGSRRFLGALERALQTEGTHVDTDWLSLTRYENTGSDQRVRISRRPRVGFAGMDVTLVADVISTGLSAAFAVQWLKRRGAGSVRVCTLLDRNDARILDVPVAHAGFQAPNDVLVGYGISFMSRFDDLPHIAVLKTPVKPKARMQIPE